MFMIRIFLLKTLFFLCGFSLFSQCDTLYVAKSSKLFGSYMYSLMDSASVFCDEPIGRYRVRNRLSGTQEYIDFMFSGYYIQHLTNKSIYIGKLDSNRVNMTCGIKYDILESGETHIHVIGKGLPHDTKIIFSTTGLQSVTIYEDSICYFAGYSNSNNLLLLKKYKYSCSKFICHPIVDIHFYSNSVMKEISQYFYDINIMEDICNDLLLMENSNQFQSAGFVIPEVYHGFQFSFNESGNVISKRYYLNGSLVH